MSLDFPRPRERLPEILVGLHFIAFACLMLSRVGETTRASNMAVAPANRIQISSQSLRFSSRVPTRLLLWA
jgi:hypothetical protein